MSVKIVAELHPARRDKTIIYTEPGSVSEILARLNTGFGEEHARVCLNGEIVRDFSVKAGEGDTLWVKFVFYGSGGAQGAGVVMKGGGGLLALVGFIVAATVGWTGIGASIGIALIGTGLGMLAGGGALYNLDIPKFKNRETPEADPSIRGGRNQMRQHGRIPVLFGRHRFFPDLAATPYTEIQGNSQYYTQLFCGGYRDCVIDTGSFKLGETNLIEFSQSKNINTILSLADPLVKMEILQNGQASSLYPKCVNEQMINAILKKEDDEGHSGAIIRSTPDKTDGINVDIFFYNGLGKYDNENNLGQASVEVKVSYKPESAADSAYELLGYFTSATEDSPQGNTITESELKTKRYQVTRSGLEPGRYTVKVERLTDDSEDTKVVDTVYVGSIRSFKSAPPIRAVRQKELTIIALKVRATDQLNGAVDAFNYIATANFPAYDNSGGTGPLRWSAGAQTRNPAAALLYALKGRACQQPVDDADIDYPALERFYSWCETHAYYCDAYLAEPVTVSELFRMIGATARAEILRLDSRISVVQDVERPSPVQLLTPKNTISYSETMLVADVPDAIALGFVDPEGGYAENEVVVYNTPSGNRVSEPEVTQKINLWGVTDSGQARRIGMYNYGCMKNRPFVRTIEMDIEYLVCNKGDWIQYAGDIALAGSTQGRITAVLNSGGLCTGFYTDEPVVMDAGKTYGVRIRRADGSIILEPVLFFNDPQDKILFAEPVALSPPPEPGDVYAFGVLGKEAVDCVITDIQPGPDLTATLTCVDYSPEIFGVDDPEFILPDYVNKISPVSGAIDSGVVNPDNWRFYQVYHDGEEEPARPTGDGQDGGWHLELTVASVWQSSKMAPSRESGAWSAPVRIKGDRGDAGLPATTYKLIPSVDTIKRYDTGVLDPPAITCIQQAITGNGVPVPSDKTLTYITSKNGTAVPYTGAIPVEDWDWIEFCLYDGDAFLDRERVPVLADGPPATVYTLVPSVPMIIRNVSGVAKPSEITCTQQVVIGSRPSEPSDKTIKYITSVSQTETVYDGTVPVAWDWIEFRLYDGDTLLDRERVPVLQEGEPAKTHEVQPGASVIRVYDGMADPYRISCSQVSITGNGLPVPSDKTLTYATSLDDEQPYTGWITVNPSWAWIEFRLYDGDVLLDKERVPVLKDGVNQVRLDLPDQNILVPCDSEGNPHSLPVTAQAILYDGNTPISANKFYEKTIAARRLVYYPGDLFDPMLGDFYPVENSWWFLSQNPMAAGRAIAYYPGNIFDPMLGDFYPIGEDARLIPPSQAAIDKNGLITINQLEGDETTITVNAIYGDAVYSAPLTLIKVKDAQRPVVIDIENENTSIACDAYGDPYPGELPLQTRAILYWGSEPVSPFWFLEGGKGIGITQDGTITVERNADLAESNNVLVKAAFRGKTYTRMFTVTKVLDGDSAVALNLLPDNEVIPCDYLGNPLRGLPLTARATLYRGTQEITAAMELAEAARVEVIHYPGNIFDPMLGGFYPTLGYPVTWALINAPAGVTIGRYGLISVSATAQLGDVNEITVRAAYHGKIYEAVFGITKARGGTPGTPGKNGEDGKDGDAAIVPKYRGKTTIADTGNTGRITLVSGTTITMNDLDWVLFMGSTGWTKARLYQWHKNGEYWTVLDPAQNPMQYMEALKDITEGAPDGIFSVMFCQMLFAQQAAIDTLASRVITLLEGGLIQSQNYSPGEGGFKISYNGDAEFNNVHIAGDSLFSGLIVSGPLVLSNDTPAGAVVSYPTNSGALSINITINKLIPVTGKYGDADIIAIQHTYEKSGEIGFGETMYQDYKVYVYFKNGTSQVIAHYQQTDTGGLDGLVT
ncbi:MAG: hypothetical protein LBP23_10675, partial [Treponema sp.]|nr:hypothetical protein [Treponema sp.]